MGTEQVDGLNRENGMASQASTPDRDGAHAPSLRFDVVTIFPELFTGFVDTSIPSIAVQKGAAEIHVHGLRAFTHDKHRTVDDAPFGGGPGMVMKPEPFFECVETLRAEPGSARGKVVLLTPAGRPFTQTLAEEFAREERIVLLCGRYEGVDQRVADALADDQLSIGDYVLSGGEVPAMVVMDAVLRLLPGVVGCPGSLQEESFGEAGGGRLLEYPQYTRPAEFRGMEVPPVLTSGDHGKIRAWRESQRHERTIRTRPDLLEGHCATACKDEGEAP